MVKHVNGLKDPLLGQKLNFREYSKEFIQLLLDGKHHWVRIITLDCQPGEVNYYNSKFKGKLTKSVKNEICCITRFKGENIKIDIVPVQQQQNGFQCGAYAIEFTVFLIKKEDLTSISFYEKKLRFHLYDCYNFQVEKKMLKVILKNLSPLTYFVVAYLITKNRLSHHEDNSILRHRFFTVIYRKILKLY